MFAAEKGLPIPHGSDIVSTIKNQRDDRTFLGDMRSNGLSGIFALHGFAHKAYFIFFVP